MYETDRVLVSVDGNMDQLLIERMINSVHVTSTRHMSTLSSTIWHSLFTLEYVAKIFNAGLGTAKDILNVITQEGVQHAESKYKLIHDHTGAIVISNGNLMVVYPTSSKSGQDSTESLHQFTEDIGILVYLKCDMAALFVGQHTNFQRLVQK